MRRARCVRCARNVLRIDVFVCVPCFRVKKAVVRIEESREVLLWDRTGRSARKATTLWVQRCVRKGVSRECKGRCRGRLMRTRRLAATDGAQLSVAGSANCPRLVPPLPPVACPRAATTRGLTLHRHPGTARSHSHACKLASDVVHHLTNTVIGSSAVHV